MNRSTKYMLLGPLAGSPCWLFYDAFPLEAAYISLVICLLLFATGIYFWALDGE